MSEKSLSSDAWVTGVGLYAKPKHPPLMVECGRENGVDLYVKKGYTKKQHLPVMLRYWGGRKVSDWEELRADLAFALCGKDGNIAPGISAYRIINAKSIYIKVNDRVVKYNRSFTYKDYGEFWVYGFLGRRVCFEIDEAETDKMPYYKNLDLRVPVDFVPAIKRWLSCEHPKLMERAEMEQKEEEDFDFFEEFFNDYECEMLNARRTAWAFVKKDDYSNILYAQLYAPVEQISMRTNSWRITKHIDERTCMVTYE